MTDVPGSPRTPIGLNGPLSNSVSSLSSSTDELRVKGEDVGKQQERAEHNQAVFAERRSRLLDLIRDTRSILDELNGQNPAHPRTVHYPASALKRLAAKHGLRRLHDDGTDGVTGEEDELRVLQIDIKSYKDSPTETTDNAFVSALLATKVQESTHHLDKLFTRISDTRSKVLVTGDLNAGKSTFVNAVLRREVVPDDQQPCTALFAEVVDVAQNDGREEVHGISDPTKYQRNDRSTYDLLDFSNLREIIEENEHNYELLKVYCKDGREKSHSLLHNGVVDITLIDSPGLNIDSMKTTALFATQEEIDVVIFVVNAENHFTLSGREFLTTAGKEKAYVFIVVNRFDQIRRKDRCRKDILEQIRQISPRTYEESSNLVHFVSAKQCLQNENTDMMPAFIRLEECLRSFILEKRARSKLAPAKVYLHNLLSDVVAVARYNSHVAAENARKITKEINDSAPAFDRMVKIKEQVLDGIDKTIDETGNIVQRHAKEDLMEFLDNLEAYTEDVEWDGVFYVLQYARNLRNTVYRLASLRLGRCENFARDRSVACLKNIEGMAASCMDVPPVIDLSVVATAFEGDAGTGVVERGGGAVAKVVPMEVTEVFDQTDKMEIAKEYVPSLGLMCAGLVGYRRMVSQSWRAASSFGGGSNAGKLAFAGLTIAGAGIFFYVLSDMKNNVERKILGKMRAHLTEVGFVENNVDRIAKNTRRILRLAIWEFQNQFTKILGESRNKRENQQRDVLKCERDGELFRGIERGALRVHEEVDGIDLEMS
ncbi:mitofusin [Rhizophlyctis rosea]|uniref:Mitofusin n=1 Tax=Rhizophlyctis rosea TaxID=64517 RepID=A0AAD5SK10_9FUNG|nr:mitofusin [Rhizophlyctis rosea]